MGIATGQLEHLLHLKREHGRIFDGTVLQLGRQDTYFGVPLFQKYASAFEVPLVPLEPEIRLNRWSGEQTVADTYFFRSLGFHSVCSLDHDGGEGATYIHDLNQPVPPELHGRFDLVYDSGTTEHVFDVAQVFRNIHALTKSGGVIIHESPTNNFVDHGFWQLSPTAFADAYMANGYERLAFIVCDMRRETMHTESYGRRAYSPAAFASASVGGHGAEMLMTFCAYQKPKEHRPWVIPQQGFYQRYWKQG